MTELELAKEKYAAARRMKEIKALARRKRDYELKSVRPLLEDLVRAAYPLLKEQCLCSRCLMKSIKDGAGRPRR